MAKKKKEKDYIDLDNQRFGLFMNQASYDLDIELGREFVNNDVSFIITLHRINVVESKVDELYGEADPSEKVFFKPVKLRGIVDIEATDQKYMSDGGIVRDDSGNLVFRVYIKELKEKNVEINRGDIIAYNISGERERYFEVEYANTVNDDSTRTFASMKPYWIKVIAVPVKGDVIPF